MRQLTNIVILIGMAGIFFSGFVFWMAHSSHQEADRLRRHGEYCDVEVVGKRTSSGGDGSSTSHYVDVRPVSRDGNSPPIQCGVVSSAYDQLYVGQRLKAWVLGADALLDDGPKNAASVARTMLITLAGFALVTTIGLILKVTCRTRSVERTAAAPTVL